MRRENGAMMERGEQNGERKSESASIRPQPRKRRRLSFFRAPRSAPLCVFSEKPKSRQEPEHSRPLAHRDDRNRNKKASKRREKRIVGLAVSWPAAFFPSISLSSNRPVLPLSFKTRPTASSFSTPRASPWIPWTPWRPIRSGNRRPGRRRRRAKGHRPQGHRRRGRPRPPKPGGSCSCRWPRPARGLLPCGAWFRRSGTRGTEGGV